MSEISWNRQLGLAVALFALGMGAYWLEFKHKPEQESSEETSKRVFQLKDTLVESVTLFDGAKPLSLVCSDLAAKLCKAGDNSKWEISEPVKTKADDSNSNALVSTLNTLSPSETIDLKDETPEKRLSLLKEYGLDASARKTGKRVEIQTSAGKSILYLGLPHPIGETTFALKEEVLKAENSKNAKSGVNENKVYLIPGFFKSNLEHDFTYWRNKKLFALNAHEVESFKIDGGKTHLSAERKDGQWTLHSGPSQSGTDEFAGDLENIDSFLSSVVFLNAKSFVSDSKTDSKALAALRGFSPTHTLIFQKEKGTAKDAPAPFTLTLLERKSDKGDPNNRKLYAVVSTMDPLFELDSSNLARLDKTLKDLRLAKLITTMDRFAAKRLQFSGAPLGSAPLTFVSKDGKWLNTADQTEASSEKIQGALDKLSGNRIKDFLAGSAIPSGEKEGVKFVLGDEKVEAKREFVFWKKEGHLYGRDLQSKRNEAFLIDEGLEKSLPWEKDFFKASQPKGTPSGSPKK